jgi:hypothetical protein
MDPKLRLSGFRTYFISWKFWVQISARISPVVTEVFRGFPQCRQANAEMVL